MIYRIQPKTLSLCKPLMFVHWILRLYADKVKYICDENKKNYDSFGKIVFWKKWRNQHNFVPLFFQLRTHVREKNDGNTVTL